MRLTLLPLLLISFGSMGELPAAKIAGTSIIPHTIESSMRFRRPRDTNLAAEKANVFKFGPPRAVEFTVALPH